jgi:hypothetical protein
MYFSGWVIFGAYKLADVNVVSHFSNYPFIMAIFQFSIPSGKTATAYSRLVSFFNSNLPNTGRSVDVTFGPDGMVWTWCPSGTYHMMKATITCTGPLPEWKCRLNMDDYYMLFRKAKNKSAHSIDTTAGVLSLDGQQTMVHEPNEFVSFPLPASYGAHAQLRAATMFDALDIYRKGFTGVKVESSGGSFSMTANYPIPSCNVKLLSDSVANTSTGDASVIMDMKPLFKMTTARTFSESVDVYMGPTCPFTMLYTMSAGIGDLLIMISQKVD